ncbi:MAG: hypothetical protein H6R10_1461 [Rhodocyclaceae bacterium]|nr:hypothetical protein [Rhodocyclaceae bacterium]
MQNSALRDYEALVSPSSPLTYHLSTEAFAALNQVKPQTVRKRLCETGSYWGVVPKKLRNLRLAWPAVQVS